MIYLINKKQNFILKFKKSRIFKDIYLFLKNQYKTKIIYININ